ncbi:MAG TPA: sigma-E factor negative regulatory protein [Usitatibacteraceae bacterium]|nr:sigma-E factor negative regulatory protein [Usitatibacteraceae bacterium]
MTQELSSLMDGELGAQEAERAIRNCCGDEELRHKWRTYHLIGEALRGEGTCASTSTRRIMEAIGGEPTVLAPRRRVSASAGRIAFAAAASVATVAVVGWIGLQDRGTPTGPAVALSSPATPPPVVADNVVPLKNVNEYVVVHRQLPNADFYRPVANQAAAVR